MEAHRPRAGCRTRPRNSVLPSARSTTSPGTIKALMAAPADAELEERQRGRRRPRMSTPSRKMKENRPEVPLSPGGSWLARPGWQTRSTAGCACSRVAIARARRLVLAHPDAAGCEARGSAARHRTARACRRDRGRPRRGSCRSAPRPATMPATTSQWPPRYFEAEWTTRSTPSDSGCWNIGARPAVVDDGDGAVRLGEPRQGQRGRGLPSSSWSGFQIEQRGARQGLRDRRFVAAVDIGDLDLHALQQRLEEAERVGIDMLDRDDARRPAARSSAPRGDRRHAAGKADARLPRLRAPPPSPRTAARWG